MTESGAGRSLTGRLFGHKPGGGDTCSIEIARDVIVARVGDIPHELSLAEATVNYGGNEDGMLVVEATRADGGKLSLYAPRVEAVRDLRAIAGDRVGDALDVLEERHTRKRQHGRLALLGIVAAIIAIVVVVFAGIDGAVGWGLGKIPPSWEVGLGQSIMESMHPAEARLDTPAIRAHIDPIVDRLLEGVPPTAYEFEVHVIHDGQVNAFALPGGQIAVYTGLLAKCERPEQLAGVLAHEIQHVLRRHSLGKLGQALKWQLVLSLVFGDLGAVEQIILGNAADLFSLSHDRDQEREADHLGLDLLYASEIEPDGMAQFFEVLSAEEDGVPGALTFLSTHPGGQERVDSIREMIDARGAPSTEPFDIDWESFRTSIEEMTE